MGYQEFTIEGRNAVIEAYRSGKPIDKLFILDGCQDGPMMTIKREAKKHDTLVKYVTKERLDQLSETGKHQGVIAYAAAYEYAEVDDILEAARKKGEPPFIFLLDNIEDPHNLGAIIRTANLAGAHGVIIPKNRAAGLTATVARTSAGALNYTPVAKVTNLAKTIEKGKLPDATEEEMILAAKAAHAHTFIQQLPQGYDTEIRDGGNLSQGQKQLLCIARVMLCLPPMLILDEATSSIDTRTEQKIQNAFAKMMEGRTSFIVAHRLSTIQEADLILVMKDGHIIEQGNHESLLAQKGFYYTLYNSQFAH